MLIPAARVAGNDEGHLGQAAEGEVVEIAALAAARPLILRPALPENEDVVRVAVGDAVEADVVHLPRHARRLEPVENDGVVEDAESPDAVGRNSTGGAGREIEAVGPGRAHQ